MKLISRSYLGLDVDERGLRAVALERNRNKPALAAGRTLELPGQLLRLSLRDPHVHDPKEFIQRVQEVLRPLAGREERVALSLPDAAGRILLHDIEMPFKSKAEGLEILKWQLKQALPDAPQDVHLDYQVMSRDESGRLRLLVAVIANKILNQYEDLLIQAGFHAVSVDFHSLHMYNFYRSQLDRGDDVVLVGIDGKWMGIQLFQSHQLLFHRSRDIGADPGRVFQECARTLAGGRDQFPGLARARICLHSDWEDEQPLVEALSGAFEREVTTMDPHLEKLALAPLGMSGRQTKGLVAAIGAAESMM